MKKDIINKKFGRLLVIEKSDIKINSNYAYKCICDCGNSHLVRKAELERGSTRSCGCYQKENIKQRCAKDPKFVTITHILCSCRYRAKRAKLQSSLTRQDVENLIFSNCFYCGSTLSNVHKSSLGKTHYNGIDRLDNNKGYTIENCVPCCSTCNTMKLTLSIDEFYNHIGKIFERLIKRNQEAL